MRFYRNLGPICFAGETNAFELFSAQPSTHIFQPKSPQQQLTHYQKIATFYNNYLGNDNFQAYQQKGKNVSLICKNSKKQQLYQMDCNSLCSWILEATKIVLKVTETIPGFYGDFTTTQFFTVGTRKVFVYIPNYPKNSQDKQRKQIQGIAKLVYVMRAEKDISQQLLAKKLAKCSSLQDIIEQLGYFSNIYGQGLNKKYQNIMKLQHTLVGKKVNKNDKSKRKSNLFQLDIKKSQPTFYSYHENNYLSTQTRKSSPAIHISIPEHKKSTVSLHTTSQRGMRPFSGRKSQKNLGSVINLKNSKLKESIETKENDKVKLSKRIINKSGFEESAVNKKDEQKLLKRLQNRKKEEKKMNEIDFTKSIKIQQNNIQSVYEAKKEAFTNQSSNLISVDLPKIQFKSQIEQIQIIQQKPRDEEKMEIKQKRQSISLTKQKRQSISLVAKQSIKQVNKNLSRYQSPRPSKSKKTIINQLNIALNVSKNTPKKQQPLAPPPLISSLPINKLPIDEPEKKLKKKKIPMKSQQIANNQLQVIELDVKTKAAKVQEDVKIKKEIFNQTRKNSFKSPKTSQFQQTKRVFKKQPTVQEKLNERLKNVDLMGVAVANTIGHLTNYQKIFWELPMFFIYRAFYLFRVQIIEKLQQLPYGTTPLKQIKEENSKIFQSVTKLIKIINKKMKKDDPNLLSSVKTYLTLQSRVNCIEPMKLFLRQYILSLQEAIDSNYSELTLHLLEIVDAYLVYFGESIDFSARTKAESNKEQMNVYLQKQLKAIKTYF